MKKLVWEKKGQVFNPNDHTGFGRTHGQIPYYINTGGQEKIFFLSRGPLAGTGQTVSHIHAVDVTSAGGDIKISKLHNEPLLTMGMAGAFDDTGNMLCSIINHPEKDEVWMYYAGWTRKLGVPYDNAIGLAISKDGGNTFTRFSDGPVMGAYVHDPFIVSCPRVYVMNGRWYMIYLAGIQWLEHNGKKEPYYQLKMATSADGIRWQRNDRYIVPAVYEQECQTCPTIFEQDGIYHMYFTYRHATDYHLPGRHYKIGHAWSADLETWVRDDEAGNFDVSATGWDSEMVCYPSVHNICGERIMFYCGNSSGKFGFGYAKLVTS